jgi:hypothetical protein
VLLAQVWTHWRLSWYFLPNPIFAICLNFQQQNPIKNQYLLHLSSKNCEIHSIKSYSLRAFEQYQECPQITIQFLVLILFNFHWENNSIINNFHIVAPNCLKPNQCTSTHWELSKDIKSVTWSTMVWEISTWQNKTKQNTMLHKF